MDVAEISIALGVREGTTKTTLHRARKALAATLGESIKEASETMGVDDRLRRELGALAPADAGGAYERVVEKRVRRGYVRRAQIAGLAVIVVAGSVLGLYGLLRAFGVGGHATPAAPHAGGILFVDRIDGQVGIFVVQPDGTGLRRINDLPAAAHAVWSPDRGRIAYIGVSGAPDESDVYVMNADGTGIHRVTRSGGVGGGPTWSPDGSRLGTSMRVYG